VEECETLPWNPPLRRTCRWKAAGAGTPAAVNSAAARFSLMYVSSPGSRQQGLADGVTRHDAIPIWEIDRGDR